MTIVRHDDSERFDAATLLRVAEAERVSLISMVGDAYARPVIEELRRHTYDLSALSTLGIGGAATSEECKVDILELLPHVTIMDGYGSSETGGMAFGRSEEHTSELQSLMRISYAVFCLKKNTIHE